MPLSAAHLLFHLFFHSFYASLVSLFLWYHIVFSPSLPSSFPTVSFSLLSASHPPLTPPLLLISHSVTPRAFCSHFLPFSVIHFLSPCLISWMLHWWSAVACWSRKRRGLHVFLKSVYAESLHGYFSGYWLNIFWIMSSLRAYLYTCFSCLEHTFLRAHLNSTSQSVRQSGLGTVLFCSSFQ